MAWRRKLVDFIRSMKKSNTLPTTTRFQATPPIFTSPTRKLLRKNWNSMLPTFGETRILFWRIQKSKFSLKIKKKKENKRKQNKKCQNQAFDHF